MPGNAQYTSKTIQNEMNDWSRRRSYPGASFGRHKTKSVKGFPSCEGHCICSGHSFLPCDEDFGVDEKQKRKNEQVFTLHEWMKVAQRARKSNKFDVMEMEQFLDFKQLVRQCVNRKVNANGEKVEWLRIRWMQFVKAIPGTSGFKLHTSTPWTMRRNLKLSTWRAKEGEGIVILELMSWQICIQLADRFQQRSLVIWSLYSSTFLQYIIHSTWTCRINSAQSLDLRFQTIYSMMTLMPFQM